MSQLSYLHNLAAQNSGIRAMFERAEQLKSEGKDVINLALGNPIIPPPPAYFKAAREQLNVDEAATNKSNPFQYTPNTGRGEVRESIAEKSKKRFGIPFDADHVVMLNGAANGLDIICKTLIEPIFYDGTLRKNSMGEIVPDEIVYITPGFVEYENYIKDNQGKPVPVSAQDDFHLDLEAIAKAINPQTRAIILNSPNNPTGIIYDTQEYHQLTKILKEKSALFQRPITVIEDAPYDRIVFQGNKWESMLHHYNNTIYITSMSKSRGLGDRRSGYLLIHPFFETELKQAIQATIGSTQRKRLVNAGSWEQTIAARLDDKDIGDMSLYEENTQKMADALEQLGFPLVRPEGAFYVFPELPPQFKDFAEFKELAESGNDPLLVVPGIAFGGKKYARHIRICASVPSSEIDRAIKKLEKIVKEKNSTSP